MEWAKKASFDHLNKLFEITANERNHQTLLMNKNLIVVIQKPKSYVLSIIPHPVFKVLVPNEHHVLKDLPFYEVMCARHKGTLRLVGPKREKVSEGDAKASSGWKPSSF